MMLFRLALPAAALAALVSANIARAEDPVRQFLTDEFKKAAPQTPESDTPASTQRTAAVEPERSDKKNANPWAGLTTASAAPLATAPAAIAPTVSAPAIAASRSHLVALVDKHAAANGLPASFARAIVNIESRFNPRATGRQREVGLMQIKFETARGIGYTGTREQLYDPDTNLKWGMKYLAMAWKLGGNNPCGAVMKYQGGHGVTRMSAAASAYCARVKSQMASAH